MDRCAASFVDVCDIDMLGGVSLGSGSIPWFEGRRELGTGCVFSYGMSRECCTCKLCILKVRDCCKRRDYGSMVDVLVASSRRSTTLPVLLPGQPQNQSGCSSFSNVTLAMPSTILRQTPDIAND